MGSCFRPNVSFMRQSIKCGG